MPGFALLVVISATPDDAAIARAFEENGAKGVVATAKEIEQSRGAGNAVKTLSRLLEHNNIQLRAAAAHALGSMGDSGKAAMDDIASALSEFGVAHYLAKYGAGDIPVWLAEAVLRPDSTSNAFFALQMLGPEDERLVPLFVEALSHPHLDVRWSSVVLLADMGEKASAARPTLVRLLEQEPRRQKQPGEYFSPEAIREKAAFALGCIGSEPEKTVKLLTGLLKRKEVGIRTWSALGLGRMGANAKAAIPALIDMLADEESVLPPASCILSAHPDHAACTALVNIGEDSVPALVQSLNAKNAKVRLRAAEALLFFGPQAEAATNDLIRLLQDEDADVRCKAAGALYWIAPDDKRLVTEMVRLTHAKQPRVRAAGASTLGLLKPEKQIPLDPILRLLNDPEPVREAALGSLESLAPQIKSASRDSLHSRFLIRGRIAGGVNRSATSHLLPLPPNKARPQGKSPSL